MSKAKTSPKARYRQEEKVTKKNVNRGIKSTNQKTKKGYKQSFFEAVPSRAWVVIAVFLFAGIAARFTLFSQAGVFEYIGKHPQASLQTTNIGKHLHTLKAWNGKIYAGYGDYSANTGPISLTPYNPSTDSFASTPEFIADTESIEIMRLIGNNLYIPSIDPRSGDDYTVGTATSTGVSTTWNGKRPIGMTHVFDMTTLNGPNDIWLAGSKGNDAVIYHSPDGGNTWELSLTQKPSPDHFARFYMIGSLNGKLYTQAIEAGSDLVATKFSRSKVYSRGSWSNGPDIGGTGLYYHTEEFAGKLIYQTYITGGNLSVFDGRSTNYSKSILNYTITPDGYLYALGSDRTIFKTKDLQTWETVVQAPTAAKSIEVLDDYIYIGTYNSELYRANIRFVNSDTIPPSVSITAPVNGSSVNGTIALGVATNDNVDVSKVSYYLNGIYIASSNQAPFSASWNTLGYKNGNYILTAIAQDSALNTATSNEITISINNTASDDVIAPRVTFTSPREGDTIKGSVKINGSGYDNVGVVRIELVVDGDIIEQVSSSRISVRYNTKSLLPGAHKFTLNAYDAAGNMGTQTINVIK